MSKIRVLFLCTGNSARSIIGAALLAHIAPDDFDPHSAGTHPKGVNPYTVRVLGEAGIDVSAARSTSVTDYEGQSFGYVITVCDAAAEECPVFPGQPQRIHWSFVDPAAVEGSDEEKLAAFRRTLREMQARLATFITVARRTRSTA